MLARAKALDEADRSGEALRLLLDGEAALDAVPAAYLAAIGRLFVRDGNHAAGADYLLRARDALGGTAPAGMRRDLAMALLASGRVEAAGGLLQQILADESVAGRPAWVARPACMAAIEAFRAAIGDAPDTGPPTPQRVLAQAESLAEAADPEGALALLSQHRGDWDSVPAPYDSAMRRLAALARDVAAEADRLIRARDACAGPVPAELRLALGTALFDLGRIQEAGQELSLAAEGGADIARLPLGLAIDLYRRARGDDGGYETGFGRSFTLVNAEKRLAYVPIAKNACTLLKVNFVMNSPYAQAFLASRMTIHDFCATVRPPTALHEAAKGPDYVRFAVLRNPFARLVSAYLNKIVRTRRNRPAYLRIPLVEHTIRTAQLLAGIEFDPVRSITFEEFVRFLAGASDAECNEHWMPQFRFVGTDLGRYQHVGTVERVQDTLDWLAARFGFALETRRETNLLGATRHITKYGRADSLAAPYRALPRELDMFEDDMAEPDRFYTAELRQIVEERFVEDLALYRAAL